MGKPLVFVLCIAIIVSVFACMNSSKKERNRAEFTNEWFAYTNSRDQYMILFPDTPNHLDTVIDVTEFGEEITYMTMYKTKENEYNDLYLVGCNTFNDKLKTYFQSSGYNILDSTTQLIANNMDAEIVSSKKIYNESLRGKEVKLKPRTLNFVVMCQVFVTSDRIYTLGVYSPVNEQKNVYIERFFESFKTIDSL